MAHSTPLKRWLTAALSACPLVLFSCAPRATGVFVTIDTDLDRVDGRVSLKAWVFRGQSAQIEDGAVEQDGGALPPMPAFSRLVFRVDAERGDSLPATFTVVPARGQPIDEQVELVVEAQNPHRTVRRRHRFRFTPGRTTDVRLNLLALCGDATTGCVGTGPCTVQRLCEQRGLTCGDTGACVPLTITPVEPVVMDAATVMDATINDVAPRPVECGDRRCSPSENACSCPADCAPLYGDGCCSPGETICQGESACMDRPGDGCCGNSPCVECLAGQVRCGEQCVDTTSSPLHCGRCGNVCTVGQVCDRSMCTANCTAPRRECVTNNVSACVDTASNPAHCGMCGRACTAAQMCLNGECIAPPTCTVQIAPSVVACGTDATASWTCSSATSCEAVCNGNRIPLDCGAGAPVTAPIRVDTGGVICDFTARNALGSMTQRVSAGCSPPPVCTVNFAPSSVPCGTQSTASWSCTNSTRCRATCTGMAPFEFDCPSGVPASAPLTVPVGGLSCQFSAMGPGGTFNTTASASCVPPPTCTVALTPSSVACPGMVTGQWTCRNAMSCSAVCNGAMVSLPCPDGVPQSAPVNAVAPSGASCVFTATGPGGTFNTTVSAACIPPPTCTVRLNPSSVTCPGSTTGEWTCRNAMTCSADCGAGPVTLMCPDGVPQSAAGIPATSPSGASCRFTATGAGGTFNTTVTASCR